MAGRGANKMGLLKERRPHLSAEIAAGWIVTAAPTTETVRPSGRRASERVGRQGWPPFQSTGRLPVDGLAVGDLEAGRNDLADGEAQTEPGCRSRRAQDHAPAVGSPGVVLACVSSALSEAARDCRRFPLPAAKPLKIRRWQRSQGRRLP